MQKTETFRRIENVVDAALSAYSVVDRGEGYYREEFSEEYQAFLQVSSSLHGLIEKVSAGDESETELWNALLDKTATMATGLTGPYPGVEDIRKSDGCKCGAGGCRSGRPGREGHPVPSVQMSALAGQVTGGFSLAEIMPAAELLRDQILSDIEQDIFLAEDGVDYYFRAFETMRGILRMFKLAISDELFPSDVLEFYFRGELVAERARPLAAQTYIVKWAPREQS